MVLCGYHTTSDILPRDLVSDQCAYNDAKMYTLSVNECFVSGSLMVDFVHLLWPTVRSQSSIAQDCPKLNAIYGQLYFRCKIDRFLHRSIG